MPDKFNASVFFKAWLIFTINNGRTFLSIADYRKLTGIGTHGNQEFEDRIATSFSKSQIVFIGASFILAFCLSLVLSMIFTKSFCGFVDSGSIGFGVKYDEMVWQPIKTRENPNIIEIFRHFFSKLHLIMETCR